MFHGGGAQLILNAENARYPSPGRAETYVKPKRKIVPKTKPDTPIPSNEDRLDSDLETIMG